MTILTAKANIFGDPNNETAELALGNMWDFISEMLQAAEYDIACAATLNIGAQASSRLRLTGSAVTVTSLGTTYRGPILVRISATYSFVHNSVALACPGGRNLTVGAGDLLLMSPKCSVSGLNDGWQIAVVAKGDGSGFFSAPLKLLGAAPLVFEGATENSYTTTFSVTDPTANRIITLPNADVDLSLLRAASYILSGISRFATPAEQLAGVLDGVGCTPWGLASVKSYATSGYQKFPGGLILQWGRTTNFGDIGGGSIAGSTAFPITFPTAVLNAVVCTAVNVNNTAGITVGWDYGSTTTSTLHFDYNETGAYGQPPWNIVYFAVGY